MSGVLGELVDGALDAVNESLAGLGQVGAARGCGVVAVSGGRGAGVEIAVTGEALRQQFGADDLAVLENEASGGLVGEEDSGDAGDEERIAQAEQNCGNQSEAN